MAELVYQKHPAIANMYWKEMEEIRKDVFTLLTAKALILNADIGDPLFTDLIKEFTIEHKGNLAIGLLNFLEERQQG